MKKNQKRILSLLLSAMTAVSVTLPPCCSNTAFAATTPDKQDYNEIDANWAKLLQYSLCFYDANMCGTGVIGNNVLSWRGNCHTYDAAVPLNSKSTNMSDSFIKENLEILDPDGDGTIDVSGREHTKAGLQTYSYCSR